MKRAALLLALTGPAACIPAGAPPPASQTAVAPGEALVENPVAPAPPPKPAWEARPVAPDAQIVRASVRTVRAGDSLSAIALDTGTSVASLARENGLTEPYPLTTGQRLAIPAGRYHRVRTGQTGIGIARAYDVEWSGIVALNGLTEPFLLRTGTVLRLPADADPVAPAAQAGPAPAIGDILTGGEPAAVTLSIPARLPRHTRRQSAAAVAAITPIAQPAQFSGRFDPPVTGHIVQRFGAVEDGIVNEGLDYGIAAGTAVGATADGVVVFADQGARGYGGLVLIKHGDGYASAYGHLSTLAVRRGDVVQRGQTLGRSGQPSTADRPFLHFEIRRAARPLDPSVLIAGR